MRFRNQIPMKHFVLQVRSKLWIGLLLGGGLAAASWLYGLGLVGVPFVVAQLRSPLGGHWEVIDTSTALGHPSTSQRLIQRRGPIYLTLAKDVGLTQYLGDNCIAYEASNEESNSTWAACDFKAPVELYEGFGRARFQGEKLTVEEFDHGNLVPAKVLSFSEIRDLARGK